MTNKTKKWGFLKRSLANIGIIMDRKVTQEVKNKEEEGKLYLSYERPTKGTDGSLASTGLAVGIIDGHPIRDYVIGGILDSQDTNATYGFTVKTASGLEFSGEMSKSRYNELKGHKKVRVRYSETYDVIKGRSTETEPIRTQRRTLESREFVGIEKLVNN